MKAKRENVTEKRKEKRDGLQVADSIRFRSRIMKGNLSSRSSERTNHVLASRRKVSDFGVSHLKPTRETTGCEHPTN